MGLHNKSILLIGLGGLGCPTVLELVSLGFGRVILMDPDKVEPENLHRQIIYSRNDRGRPKVEVMTRFLRKEYPNLEIEGHEAVFSESDHASLIRSVDLVIEASDDGPNKILVNRMSVELGRPAIIGGAIGYGGQVFVIPKGGRPCMGCLFGDDLDLEDLESCSTAGILGPVTGVIGFWMARLGSQLLMDQVEGGLLVFEGRRLKQRWRKLSPQQDCLICSKSTSPSAIAGSRESA